RSRSTLPTRRRATQNSKAGMKIRFGERGSDTNASVLNQKVTSAMEYSPEQEELLAKLAEAILDAFDSITRAARTALGQPGGRVDELLPPAAQQNLQRIRSETRMSLEMLIREPAIARVEVQWPDSDTTEQIYVSRGSSTGMLPQDLLGKLVS